MGPDRPAMATLSIDAMRSSRTSSGWKTRGSLSTSVTCTTPSRSVSWSSVDRASSAGTSSRYVSLRPQLAANSTWERL